MTPAIPALSRLIDLAVLWLEGALPLGWRGLTTCTPEGPLPPSGRVRLILPASAILLRRLDVPATLAAQGRARDFVAARLEDLSPWAAGEYLWDMRPETDSSGSTRAEVALTPLAPVRAFAADLAGQGSRLAEITGSGFTFQTDLRRRSVWRRRLIVGVAGLTLVGLFMAGGGLNARLRAGEEIAVAEVSLQRVAEKSHAQNAVSASALALLGRKTDAQSFARLLALLAGRLPDDSWLETLSMEPSGFEISGRSARPEAIVPALEADAAFAGVDFAGSSSRDPTTGQFSFTIRGGVSGLTGAAP